MLGEQAGSIGVEWLAFWHLKIGYYHGDVLTFPNYYLALPVGYCTTLPPSFTCHSPPIHQPPDLARFPDALDL